MQNTAYTLLHTPRLQTMSCCAHSATYMLFLSVCPSVNPADCLSVCPSITTVSSNRLLLPSPLSLSPSMLPALHTTYPLSHCQLMHTGLHCSEVGACQSSRAQYRVYRHACTCQPGREGWGGGRGREREQRRVSGECVESGRQDDCATLPMYTQTLCRMTVFI